MPHFPPNAYFCTMQPSEELRIYIETEIIPRYESFDAAHGTDHVRTVIAQSLDLARHYDVDADMIYAAAAYHDTGPAASGPHQRATSGAASSVKISRMTLHSRATVPSSAPRKSAIKMLDSE